MVGWVRASPNLSNITIPTDNHSLHCRPTPLAPPTPPRALGLPLALRSLSSLSPPSCSRTNWALGLAIISAFVASVVSSNFNGLESDRLLALAASKHSGLRGDRPFLVSSSFNGLGGTPFENTKRWLGKIHSKFWF